MKQLSALLLLTVAVTIGLSGCSVRSPAAQAARYIEQGKKLAEKKDYSRALLQYKNAIQLQPKDAEAYYQSALAYLGQGQLESALVNLLKATDLNPKHVAAQLKFSELLAKSGNKGLEVQAQRRLQDVLVQSPENADALAALAMAETNLGQPQDAVKHLEEALAKAPANLKSSMELASLKLAQKDAAGAEAILKRSVEQAPRSAELAVVLGRFYWWGGNVNLAKTELRRALDIQPKYQSALFDLATLDLATGNPAAADRIYQQLSSLTENKHLHALFLIRQKNYDPAIAELRALLKADPVNRTARSLLVHALVITNRSDQATNVLAQAVRKNPHDTDALVEQSQLNLKAGNVEEAERNLRQALHFRGDSAVAHLVLARVHAARNNGSQEQQELRTALQLDPKLLSARIRLSDLLIQANSGQAALEVMDQAPTPQKDTAPVIAQRNWALLALHESAEFHKGVEQGLRLAKLPDLLTQDAIWKFDRRDFDGGRVSIEMALAQNPANPRALELLYNSYLAQQRRVEGLARLQEHARKNPSSAVLQYFVAKQLRDNGQREEARQALAAALKAQPKFTLAGLSLAQMDLEDHNLDTSRNRVSSILSHDPKNVAALFLLGNIEDETGDRTAALDQYRKVVALDGSNLLALNNLAFHLAYVPEGQTEAVQYAQKAVEISPDNPEVQDTLGWVYYKAGMYSRAMSALQSAASQGNVPERKFHLALVYLKTGRQRQASEIIQTIERTDPAWLKSKTALALIAEATVRR